MKSQKLAIDVQQRMDQLSLQIQSKNKKSSALEQKLHETEEKDAKDDDKIEHEMQQLRAGHVRLQHNCNSTLLLNITVILDFSKDTYH